MPKQKAADDNERELAKWIHNVTTGHVELSDEYRARFDALVNRSAQQKQTAQDRVLDVKAFVKEHGRAPHSGRPDASQQERKLALWIGHVRERGFGGLDDRLRAELEVAIDEEYIKLCAFEAWCEKHQRMPREKAKDDEERKLANFAANRERGGRPSHTVFNALDTFEQLRERFGDKEAARRAARERAAQVQRAEQCRREQLASAAAAEEEAELDEEEADAGAEGDCGEGRRPGIPDDVFARLQAADRALDPKVKSALAGALISLVDELEPDAALGFGAVSYTHLTLPTILLV